MIIFYAVIARNEIFSDEAISVLLLIAGPKMLIGGTEIASSPLIKNGSSQ